MSVLITGAAGFVGRHLINQLQKEGNSDISVIALNQKEAESLIQYGVKIHAADILSIDSLEAVFYKIQPEYIYHLAAQSSVELSWSNPALTADVNIKGTINVLETIRKIAIKSRVLLIGSGDEYGNAHLHDDLPINEDTRLAPSSIYAVTKVCQNMLGSVYSKAYGMDLIMTRAFNHIGPGQSPAFVVSDFCRQAVEIEKGKTEPVMKVGNIEVKRDFTDVRDVVRAYILLMKKGVSGETYNISSGKSVSIKEILDIIIKKSKVKISIEMDKSRFRPSDIAVLEADSTKLRQLTGWENSISLEQSIEETLEYWEEQF